MPDARQIVPHGKRRPTLRRAKTSDIGVGLTLAIEEKRGLKEIQIRTDTRRTVFSAVLIAVFLMSSNPASAGKRTGAAELDRVAYAVEGAESSHGTNIAMWRAEPAGPQGPMQVSEKAAIDAGGGNRFDVQQNRTLGRAYIDLLHKRYGNWLDAISAYNWGPGRVDGWIKEGRPAARLVPGVAGYVRRVLRDSGLPPVSTAVHRHTKFMTIRPQIDDMFLPGLEQSGEPLPLIANSGRPLSVLLQSGLPLSASRRGRL